MKIFLTILISCVLTFGQWIDIGYLTNPVELDSIFVEQDTTIVSEAELFLKEISDKAIAKEEKREKITNKVLTMLVVILLVDKFTK